MRTLIIVTITMGIVAFYSIHIRVRIGRASELIRETTAFSRAQGASSLLVAGDSIAVGIGAQTPEESVVGRLGAAFPDMKIMNTAVSGARMDDILLQINTLDSSEHFDTAIIIGGGNDTLRWTSSSKLKKDTRDVLDAALLHADRVMLVMHGNIRHSSFFSWPLNVAYGFRSNNTRNILRDAAAEKGVMFVSLYRDDAENDPFAMDPALYYSKDGLHPSDEGYRVWFETIKNSLK